MNTHELKSRLNGQAEAVAAHLFPGGKRVGSDWVCASIHGEAGNSFKVHLSGPLLGMGKDFGIPEEKLKDLLDLWGKVKGVDFPGARKLAHEFLNIPLTHERDTHETKAAPKIYVPADNSLAQPLQSGGAVFDYLTKTRKLDPATLNRYLAGQVVHPHYGPAVVWPCFAPDGGKQPDLIKYLALERQANGKKNIWASKDSRPRLFGWHAIDRSKRTGDLTEGEIDCVTLAQEGFNVLSLPMGTGDLAWIEQDHDALESFERINLWMDMDEAGEKCAQILAHRLGRERCYRVRIPAPWKDVNAAAQGGACGADFQDWADAARTLDPGELRNIADYSDAAWEVLHPTTQATKGTAAPVALPWRRRFGEVSVWTGWSGHGKTVMLNNFILHDVSQGERACIASLEMPAAKLAATFVRLVLGCYPTAEQRDRMDAALRYVADRIWFVDKTGIQHYSRIIPVMKYAAQRYGCTRFVFDSLSRLDVDEEDYDAQKKCVGALVEFAAENGHVDLVAHARKLKDEASGPGKLDVRGSGTITDLVHNGLTVWRNKRKEADIDALIKGGAQSSPFKRLELDKTRDAALSMWKERETGEEPSCNLWFHRASGQYLDFYGAKPRNYLTQSVP